ncbi:hypothetical protein BGZ65_008600 [Modicella reniformis]|uniref:GTP-eEF1A C-terminal domain-containing protein n=1 Tax=Modicella reniformis TaxID=1440133 RepID=A0A9P6MAY8_9FUNG|nr:hypothetical protein BGZ65_008600 [Modicella reniformis]
MTEVQYSPDGGLEVKAAVYLIEDSVILPQETKEHIFQQGLLASSTASRAEARFIEIPDKDASNEPQWNVVANVLQNFAWYRGPTLVTIDQLDAPPHAVEKPYMMSVTWTRCFGGFFVLLFTLRYYFDIPQSIGPSCKMLHPVTTHFAAQIIVLHVKIPINIGFPVITHHQSHMEPGTIFNLVTTTDTSTGVVVKQLQLLN